MQIGLGSISTSGPGVVSSGFPVPSGSSKFGSFLLGSVQQAVQSTAASAQQAEEVEVGLSAFFASLFKAADDAEALGELVGKDAELVKLAEELVENGEMPSLQELAVLLQTDAEMLQQSIQTLFQSVNIKQEETGSENQLSRTDNQEAEGNLPLEELTALIGQVAENPDLLFKEGDKPLLATAVRAARLINYFAQHLQKPEPHFQPLQTAVKNAEALVNQQASLRTAFANYKGFQDMGESIGSKPASTKPSVQAVEVANPFLQQLSKTEQFVMSVKTNPRPMNMEQFIEKFEQVLGNSNLTKMPNGTKMLIKLYPEQLGSLRIELLQQNGVMTAKILSSTQTVKELLEQNAHQLKHAFAQQNVTVEKVDIASPDTRQQLFDRGAQQQRQQEQKPHEPESSENSQSEIISSFEEALQNVELEV
ncbi:flagellar hook-length control protein FliK [Domibacillus robiginosus]|uniref:flagellar hook-length control protein FliK n=1 Tax=Domibacillus robiginosus TaxID=1071054 RepID=UPI00067D9AC4|nr:flagellar hook-length control protein FliK [Domibacillus robiginosus]